MTDTVVVPQPGFHQFAAGLHQQAEPAGLVHQLLSGLQRYIPSDYNSWKEISLQGRSRVTAVFAPHNPSAAALLPAFQRHVGDHPVCNFWRRSGQHAGAYAWSDVASRPDIERLALFGEFYRPLGIHHQMMVALEVGPSTLIYVALNRKHRPFTQQERSLLALLQPHASDALQHVREARLLKSKLASFETLVDTLNQGVICLSPQNRVLWASKRARHYLDSYWRTPAGSDQLPDQLLAWLKTTASLNGASAPIKTRLAVQGSLSRLVVRLLTEKCERYLFLEEVPYQARFHKLTTLGLTEREAEVLGWVAQGKSNEDAAVVLKMCSQTVKKHLERIYSALGVANRTEAALKAAEVLRLSREGS